MERASSRYRSRVCHHIHIYIYKFDGSTTSRFSARWYRVPPDFRGHRRDWKPVTTRRRCLPRQRREGRKRWSGIRCTRVCIRGAHEWQLTFTSPVSGKLGTRLYDYRPRPRARELGLVLCECGKSSTALGNRSEEGRREGEEGFVSWKQRRRRVWKFAVPFPDQRFGGCEKLQEIGTRNWSSGPARYPRVSLRMRFLLRRRTNSIDSNKNDRNKSYGGGKINRGGVKNRKNIDRSSSLPLHLEI